MAMCMGREWKRMAMAAVVAVLPLAGWGDEEVSPESSGGYQHPEEQAPMPAPVPPPVQKPASEEATTPMEPTRVYRKVNPDGSVTFSDVASEGSSAMEVQPANTVPKYEKKESPTEPAAAVQEPATCKIVAPEHDATMGVDITTVTVTVEVAPELAAGDRLQFFANGQPLGPPGTDTSTVMNNLERGSFTVTAKVTNAKGDAVCTSEGVTFHVKRASVLFQGSKLQQQRDRLARKQDPKEPDMPEGLPSAGGFPGAGGFGSAGGVGIPELPPVEKPAPK